VAGLAAPRGEDALRGDHAVEVVRVGFPADQDHRLPLAGQLHRAGGGEDHLADGRTGRRADTFGDRLELVVQFEAREHQLGELGTVDPVQRLVQVDKALVDELPGDVERGGGGALTNPGLEHPQLAPLDGELDVAQILVVPLEPGHVVEQLVVGPSVDPLQFLQWHGVADARDDILALCVGQVVAVDALCPAGRVAGERDAGPGVRPEVAEDHGDHVHRGARFGGKPFLATVDHRPLGVPRLEDRPDREVELLARLLRELPAGVPVEDLLECGHQRPQVVGVEVQVQVTALGALGVIESVLEVLPRHIADGLAEHLDQTSVGVPGEPLVTAGGVSTRRAVGLSSESHDAAVVEADIEHGLHHARHRELGAGAYRDQQRVHRVTESPAHRPFQGIEVGTDLVGESGRLLPGGEVRLTGRGGNREAGWHRQAEVGHLGQVGALAAE